MFEDIHKIDSAVFKPDPTKSKSNREGKSGQRPAVGNKKPGSLVEPETNELAGVAENNKEHPFLDILV